MLPESVGEKPDGRGRIYFVLEILVAVSKKSGETTMALTHSGRT